jgi:4-hydroxyproline epimerase
MACLAADGKLADGAVWRQEGIVGSVFTGSVQRDGDGVIPTVRGRAWVTGEAALVLDESDPFVAGIRL